MACVRIVRMGLAVKPGVPGSRMKQEMPARPFSLLVRANTTPHFPLCAFEMKTLRPFSTHLSPRRSARRLDGAGGIGAARRLGDGEERPPSLAHRGHRVLLDLRLASPPRSPAADSGRRRRSPGCRAPCGAATSPPGPRDMLKVSSPPPPYFSGRAERPQPGRLGLGRQPLEVLVGDATARRDRSAARAGRSRRG